jgi:hypothetical protein
MKRRRQEQSHRTREVVQAPPNLDVLAALHAQRARQAAAAAASAAQAPAATAPPTLPPAAAPLPRGFHFDAEKK